MSAPLPTEVERVRVATRSGWALEATVLEGEGGARGTALFVHALGATSGAFLTRRGDGGGGLVGRVRAAGFRAVLFDLRGHGESEREANAPGPWSFDGVVRGDLEAMGETLRARFNGPLALVGHGLGGLAACAAAGALDPDALVLFGVNPWLPRLDPSPLRRLVKASLLGRGPAEGAFGRALGRTLAAPGAPAWAAFWPEAARWWAADAWLDEGGRDYLADMRRVRCPTLAFSSRADRLLCAPACAHAFVTRLGAARLEHHVADGLGHAGLVASPGAAPLWRKAARWLAQLAPRNAGAR